MESLSDMQLQAPAVSKYIRQSLSDSKSQALPLQEYINFIKQLLSAVGGKYDNTISISLSFCNFVIMTTMLINTVQTFSLGSIKDTI